MDLKEFVKSVLIDLDKAVDEARQQTSRDISFTSNNNSRTIEFDIAVTAEENQTAAGKAGVKVLKFIEAGGDLSKENKSSTVSRISFGLRINSFTKDEDAGS